jgi:hypothetical protein
MRRFKMGKLDGKIAIVTGGAMGNGRGIAEEIIAEGGTVVIADISDTVFKAAEEMGKRAYPVKADITKREEAASVAAECVLNFGTVDILVNNAGIARFSRFADISDELRDLHFNVNIIGAWNFTKAVLPVMLKNRYGRIINMSSVTGPFVADPGQTGYATSKAAMIGFTKALAVETAADNITVNAICPGYILTPMVRYSAKESNPENPQAVIDAIAAGVPMKRLGTPSEVGKLAAFLASGGAGYITGQAIIIDGGNGLPETNSMGLK